MGNLNKLVYKTLVSGGFKSACVLCLPGRVLRRGVEYTSRKQAGAEARMCEFHVFTSRAPR